MFEVLSTRRNDVSFRVTGSFQKLNGTIEADETFIGGESKNMHKHIRAKKIKGRGAVGKTAREADYLSKAVCNRFMGLE